MTVLPVLRATLKDVRQLHGTVVDEEPPPTVEEPGAHTPCATTDTVIRGAAYVTGRNAAQRGFHPARNLVYWLV